MRINKKLIKYPKNNNKSVQQKRHNYSSYITSQFQCRLGNNLFQIGTALNLAQKHELIPVFEDWKYKDFFNINAKFDTGLYNSIKWNTYRERNHDFQNISINPPLKIYGWFQSYKYLDKKLISIKQTETEYNELLDKSLCSVHFRRTDYIGDTRFAQIPMNFYLNIYNKLYDKVDCFLIFSDDIEWCKQNIMWNKCIFVEKQEDYKDLFLMSQCKYSIISNSTFAWWGAYLGKEKEVYCYRKWFDNFPSTGIDILPQEWIKE